MESKEELTTGYLTFRNIDFTYVFDGTELRLIPPKEKAKTILFDWILSPLGNGVSTEGDFLIMEEPFLVGHSNETDKKYIFFTKEGHIISSSNSVLIISLIAYIECNNNTDTISRITFTSPELNYIYPTTQALEYSYDYPSYIDNGVFSVTTHDFSKTTTEQQEFEIDDYTVSFYWGITRGLSQKANEAPISVNSTINYIFSPTSDYSFIIHLWKYTQSFLNYLCFRKNVSISSANVYTPYEGGKYYNAGTFHVIDNPNHSELEVLKNGRYIHQSEICGFEGKILSDIASDSLYLRHLPNSYEEGHHITASSFIMITSAFEWEFRRLYPSGIPKSAKTIAAEDHVETCIQELIQTSPNKRIKSIYKHLKNLIHSDSLQNEIIKTCQDFDEIIGDIGTHLYRINNEAMKYSEIGKRLADQRNHFAHGDLDEKFIGTSLLDLIFLKYLIYAMQLHQYGISKDNIRKSINNLFHLCLDLA